MTLIKIKVKKFYSNNSFKFKIYKMKFKVIKMKYKKFKNNFIKINKILKKTLKNNLKIYKIGIFKYKKLI